MPRILIQARRTQGFYFPWYMLLVDVLLGNPLMPDLMGMAAGHLYYFLTVIYPLAGGRNFCTTPYWVYPFSRTFKLS